MEIFKFNFAIITSALWVSIGSIANIFSIIIFSSKEFNKDSMSKYLTCASIMNIIAILHLPLVMFPSIWSPTAINCVMMMGLKILITQMHAWIVAMCSLDRAISTMAPFKFIFKNKLKFQLILLGIMTVILVILISPGVILSKSVSASDNKTECEMTVVKEIEGVAFYSIAQYVLFAAVLPFFIMITSSILIVLTLWKSKNKVSCNNVANNKRNYVRDIQLAKSLVTMDFFFILFKLPMQFYLIFFSIEDDGRFMSKLFYMYQIFLFISSTNIVCIFVIFLIINKLYRSIFIRYIKKIFGYKIIAC
jgi:hypothetical protein